MAIAEKLQNIINEKTAQATMTNYGLTSGNQINSSTKFIDYPKYIFNAFLEALRTPDTLFTNLPKKSGTGTNITLNDTANAPMRIELGATELSQDGTPTPSSPQDIHTISGSNKVVVCGKNLFDYSKITTSAYYTNNYNGTFTRNSNGSNIIINTNEASVPYDKFSLKAGSYSVSFDILTTSDTSFNQLFLCTTQNGTNTNLSKSVGTSISANTLTHIKAENYVINNNAEKVGIVGYLTSSTGITISNIQVEKGSTATTYEPYTSQEADIDLDTIEYCKIGTYEDKFIRTSGKQLANFTKANTLDITNGYVDLTQSYSSGTNITFTFDEITLKAGDYTFLFNNSVAGSSNSNQILYANGSTNIGTLQYLTNKFSYANFTLNETTTISNFKAWCPTASIGKLSNIMLVKGTYTSVVDYEPYGSNEWYIKKNIGKVVLDGTENWAIGNPTHRYYFATNGQLNYGANPFSNYFIGYVRDNLAGNINGLLLQNISESQMRFNVYDLDIVNDLASFKTWLSTHNVIVYYVLATPTYTKITGTLETQLENVYQKLLSYDNTTNISQINNDLAFQLGVQAIEKL